MQPSNKIPVSNNLIINNHNSNLTRRASMNSQSLVNSNTNLDNNPSSSPSVQNQVKQFNQSINYRSRSNVTNTKGSYYKFRNRIKSLDMGCYEPIHSIRSNCPSMPFLKISGNSENKAITTSKQSLRRNSSSANLSILKKHSNNNLSEAVEKTVNNESLFSEKNVSLIIDKIQDNFVKSKSVINELPNLLCQDSFKYLRIGISIFILIISIFFLLLTLFQDSNIYENVFRFVYNNIEIKNPTSHPRPI